MHFNPDQIFLLIGLLVAAAAGAAYYLEWKRGNALADLAASMGLAFSKDGPEPAFLAGTGLEIFTLGRSRKATNLIEIALSTGQLQVFDYRYITGSGKNRHAHNFTLALISCKCEMPHFDLKPETFAYKFGELLGFKDIDLPAFPLFSDKYRLTGPDETAVRMFFSPDRAAWFERNQGLRVQGAPGYGLLFKKEGRLPADAWQAFIEEAKTFAAEALK
jgi:hypothetical protein